MKGLRERQKEATETAKELAASQRENSTLLKTVAELQDRFDQFKEQEKAVAMLEAHSNSSRDQIATLQGDVQQQHGQQKRLGALLFKFVVLVHQASRVRGLVWWWQKNSGLSGSRALRTRLQQAFSRRFHGILTAF